MTDYDKNDTRVTIEFSDGRHARHFIGWWLDGGGGDDAASYSADVHMPDGNIGMVAVEHGGIRWPDRGFPSVKEDDEEQGR